MSAVFIPATIFFFFDFSTANLFSGYIESIRSCVRGGTATMKINKLMPKTLL